MQPTPVEKSPSTKNEDLANRLRKLVNVKSLDIRGTDSFIVDLVIQSPNPKFQWELDNAWDRMLADRELQLSYRIGAPVSSYTLTLVNADNIQLSQNSGAINQDEPSQKIGLPVGKSLNNEKVNEALQKGLALGPFKLEGLTTTSMMFTDISEQVISMTLRADSVEETNQGLPDFIRSLTTIVENVNTTPSGDVALVRLHIVDLQDEFLFDQVWDPLLQRTSYYYFAKGVKAYTSLGPGGGPRPTDEPASSLSSPIPTPLPTQATATK